MQNLIPSANIGEITRIEYHGQPVLTTAQLAEFYETTTNNLKMNFRNNRERFIEGKHFFCVEGTDLENFKDLVKNFYQVPKNTPILYLWTKYGCLRHCKSIGTDKAWDVFETLEDTYFNVEKILREKPFPSISNYKLAMAANAIAAHADDPYTRRKLVAVAANLLFGEGFVPVPDWNPCVQLTLFK